MLSQFCGLLQRSLRDKRLIILLVVTLAFFWFFWNFTPIRSLGWIDRNIRDFGFPYVASTTAWGNISSDPENIAAFREYYIRQSVTKVFAGCVPVVLLSLYGPAVLIGTDFTRRTVDEPLREGKSRLGVYLGSLLFFCLVSALMLVICLYSFFFWKFGTAWIPLYPPGFILRCVGLWLLFVLAFIMPGFAAVYVMKNVFGSMLVSIGLFVLQVAAIGILSLAEGGTAAGVEQLGQSLRTFVPFWFLVQRGLWEPDAVLSAGQSRLLILIPLCWILLSVIVGFLAFLRWKPAEEE